MGIFYYFKDGSCTLGHGGIVPDASFTEARQLALGIVQMVDKLDLYRVDFYYAEDSTSFDEIVHYKNIVLHGRDNHLGLNFKHSGVHRIDPWVLYKELHPEEQDLEDFRASGRERALRRVRGQDPKKMRQLVKEMRKENRT